MNGNITPFVFLATAGLLLSACATDNASKDRVSELYTVDGMGVLDESTAPTGEWSAWVVGQDDARMVMITDEVNRDVYEISDFAGPTVAGVGWTDNSQLVVLDADIYYLIDVQHQLSDTGERTVLFQLDGSIGRGASVTAGQQRIMNDIDMTQPRGYGRDPHWFQDAASRQIRLNGN